ncbi:MAG: MotA/TolQ/ExbB proton channel family protein [Methylacidiphilales bacterium]|nr:MotA/TolQ/ExbB proton channel family protein [Candidatus Methylacidiphilales bacterium]MDW8348714.1 MotA/TolQ/ExbB proton channel family protein [Verrucomicrobiae bacterium]
MKKHLLIPILLASCTLSPLTLHSQENPPPQVPPPVIEKNLLQKYQEGGPWMHAILLTSIATIAFTVLCSIQIRRSAIMPPHLLKSLTDAMSQRDVQTAYDLARASATPLGRAATAMLAKANFGRDMFNKPAMESAAGEAIAAEETKLGIWVNYLNVCAQLAPMLGLFGTVVGMIEAFDKLSMGRSEPQDLAGGIGVAMLTTAGGLIVAIPAIALYFFFRSQLTNIITDMQKSFAHMLDLFTGEIQPDGQRAPVYVDTSQTPNT